MNLSSCLGFLAVPWPWLSCAIIFYLLVCTELNHEPAPQQEARRAESHFNKNFLSPVMTSIHETPPGIILSPPTHSLTTCALQVKDHQYESAPVWQHWWSVINVERLSCCLCTFPLSSLGRERDANKLKHMRELWWWDAIISASSWSYESEDGFGTVVASSISSYVYIWKTHFLLLLLLLLLYSCSPLQPSSYHYSQSCELRAVKQRASLFSFSKHWEQREQNWESMSSNDVSRYPV